MPQSLVLLSRYLFAFQLYIVMCLLKMSFRSVDQLSHGGKGFEEVWNAEKGSKSSNPQVGRDLEIQSSNPKQGSLYHPGKMARIFLEDLQ